jgi:hypothetical protein
LQQLEFSFTVVLEREHIAVPKRKIGKLWRFQRFEKVFFETIIAVDSLISEVLSEAFSAADVRPHRWRRLRPAAARPGHRRRRRHDHAQ